MIVIYIISYIIQRYFICCIEFFFFNQHFFDQSSLFFCYRASVNGIAWAPHSSCHICTAGDDNQALIWDIQQMPRAIEDPILAYTAAEGEVNQIQWGATQPDWIAICYNKAAEILRV